MTIAINGCHGTDLYSKKRRTFHPLQSLKKLFFGHHRKRSADDLEVMTIGVESRSTTDVIYDGRVDIEAEE